MKLTVFLEAWVLPSSLLVIGDQHLLVENEVYQAELRHRQNSCSGIISFNKYEWIYLLCDAKGMDDSIIHICA